MAGIIQAARQSVSGRALIGGFDVNGQSFAFINFLKNATNQQAGTSAYPGNFDNNGYPVSAPSTAITMNVVIPVIASYRAQRYVLKQRSGTSGTWGNVGFTLPSGTFTVNADDNANLVANSGVNLTVAGSNPRLDLTFNGLPTDTVNGNTLTLTFLTTGGAYTTPDIVLCRSDQEALLDAGEVFNPDFVTMLKNLNPKIVRTMDWAAVNNTLNSQFGYRAPTTALSYRTARWHPVAWAGAITPSGNNFTCSAPSDWSVLAEGVTLQGQYGGALSGTLSVTSAANNGSGAIRLALADTSSLSTGQRIAFTSSGGTFNGGGVWTITVIDATHIDLQNSTYQANVTGTISVATLNVGGTGAKLISGSGGIPSIANNGLATIVYDSVRDSWLTVPRGMGDASSNGAIPIEIQVALANKIRTHLWSCIPFHYTDASITAHANYVRDNLAQSCYYELSNEIWNPGFTQFNYAYVRGQLLGFPTANAQNFSYHGLRSRMMFGLIETSYAASGKTNYKRVIANQFFGSTATAKTYKFNGADLAPSGVSTGTGNAAYNSFTGSANYTAFPNRPIDHADAISYATYYSGATLSQGTYAATGTYTGMTGAADSFTAGDKVTAFAWIDSDLQSGTSTIPGFDNQTLNAIQTKYAAWETVAASYDVERAGGSLANLTVDCYEGGFEGLAPTTAQCTTIGISTDYAATITTMLLEYKGSTNFQTKVLSQYNDFMVESHSATPGWFALQGASQWSMLPGSTYTAPAALGTGFSGQQYGSWRATVSFNG